ncbi:MAG: hypothetical protein Q9209_004216 [Squamulea sp. 1 TL-2023]
MASGSEDEYVIPLKDQRVFGAGTRRKKINFVPSQNHGQSHAQESSAQGAADRYLSIVLSKPIASDNKEAHTIQEPSNLQNNDGFICEICKLPIVSKDNETQMDLSKPHETSLTHQICLSHSHPPSHLNRTRRGLQYLSSYGWDPDSRLGLGATGTGIRIPLKPKPKNDTLGIGIVVPSGTTRVTKPAIKKLDAKKTRKAEEKAKQDGEKLRNIFYEREEVGRYLGGGG